MGYRLVALLSVWGALLVCTHAWANPISIEILRARQVPNTAHVQLTYGLDTSYGSGSDPQTPSSLSRDGASVAATWVVSSDGYTANTGSGLASVTAIQTCDCDVAVGQHQYKVMVGPMGSIAPNDHELSTYVLVVPNYQTPADAGVPAADMMPWEIPEPSEVQGLDCVAYCASQQPPADGATIRDAGATTRLDAQVSPPLDKDSGCAVSQARDATTLLGALLLGLALFVLGRRRA